MENKNLYIIAGCNGAGKTTASFTILPEIINCKEFVNADEIARGLSPFEPEKVALEAGRLMLNRIKDLLDKNETFAFETTLSSRTFKNTIIHAKTKGYVVTLLFFWLETIDLAIERVNIRVMEGGHYIDPTTIERRYKKGIENLFAIYLSIVDGAMIFDNSEGKHQLIARKNKSNEIYIIDESKYSKLTTWI